MNEMIYTALKPVRGRQQQSFIFQTTSWGLLIGGLAALLLGVTRLIGFTIPWQMGVAVLAAGPVIGILVGLVVRRSWQQAASAVDSHYHLKDRSVTALEFLNHVQRSNMHDLQISDAISHLKSVDAKAVVPMTMPKMIPAGVVAMGLALAFLFWPINQENLEAKISPAPDHIIALADQFKDSLQDLEEAAKDEEFKGLQELVKELKEKAEEMKKDGVDVSEALAKLSEMEAAVQAQKALLQQQVISDGQLGALGTALASSAAFEGAGKALQEAKIDKAIEELEKLENPQLDLKEAKAVEEKLKKLAKELGEAGFGSLSAALGELADDAKDGGKKAKRSSRMLAKELDKQRRKRKLTDLLNQENDKLKEAKCNCQSNSLVTGKQPNKSNNPSNNFGMTTSGNTQGEKTKLPSNRNTVDLTGTASEEGDSDVETTTSPEARQQSTRSYRERFQKFKKESEAVLESEPIPLGQRQTIRKYFELIRPQNSDMNDNKESNK